MTRRFRILLFTVPLIWRFVFLSADSLADSLHITCTAPLKNNSGTCAAPVLTSAATSDSLWVYFTITPVPPLVTPVRVAQVFRRPGGAIDLSFTVPPGSYTIVARPGRPRADGTIQMGCPAQIVAPSVTASPDTVRFQ